MAHRLPSLLNGPATTGERWSLRNARVFDSTTATFDDDMVVTVEAGRIVGVTRQDDEAPDARAAEGRIVDVGGRCLIPGLIDVHAHLNPQIPTPDPGAEPLWPGAAAHFLAAELQRALRMGVTTLRDVGSYGDMVVTARQAMRYGAFPGPRVLTCGRIVSATAPGGRFFDGMYREADGPDEIRTAVREQIRRGADYIKVMSTGARSVELEDPDPAQVTPQEMTALVEESHRLGYRVAAHAEGIAGTELAVLAGVDTIEHGMYLNQRPDLLDHMAASGQILVPTFSCFYGVAGLGNQIGVDHPREPTTSLAGNNEHWSPLLSELAKYNLDQADRTLRAARSAGVAIAAGHDWYPFGGLAIEMLRMQHHGLTTAETLLAATATSAIAAGLDEHLGTIEVGSIADLVVVDGDPLQNLELLAHHDNIWLVLHDGRAIAGTALSEQAD